MSLLIHHEILDKTTSESLAKHREHAKYLRREKGLELDPILVPDEGLRDIARAAAETGEKRLVAAIESLLRAREGDFGKPIPTSTPPRASCSRSSRRN